MKKNDPNVNWDEMNCIHHAELFNLMSTKKVDENILKKVSIINCPELHAKKIEDSPTYSDQPVLRWDHPGVIDLNKPLKVTGAPKHDSFRTNDASNFGVEAKNQEVYNFKQITPEEHKIVVDTLKNLHGNDLLGLQYEKKADIPKPIDMKELYQILDKEVDIFYQTILDNLQKFYPQLKLKWDEYGELAIYCKLFTGCVKTNIDKYALKSISDKIKLITNDEEVILKTLETVIKAELDKVFR